MAMEEESRFIISVIPTRVDVKPYSLLVEFPKPRSIYDEVVYLIIEFTRTYREFLERNGEVDTIIMVIDLTTYDHCIIRSYEDETMVFRASKGEAHTVIDLFSIYLRYNIAQYGGIKGAMEYMVKNLDQFLGAGREIEELEEEEYEYT